MDIIKKIEHLLLEEFKTVPFHNLFMLKNINNKDFSLGGTCSDKVLNFKETLINNNMAQQFAPVEQKGKVQTLYL